MADNWDPEAWTRNMMEEIRTHGGHLTSGPLAGRDLMVLTTTGARTGEPREAIVTYSRDGDAYVVAGSKNGAPTDPAWFNNLRAHPDVTVETGGRLIHARAEEATGTERDRLWRQHVERNPEFGGYPEKAGRVIPVARLVEVTR